MILCKRCDTLKPLNEFHSSKRHKNGKHCWCKKCCVKANILYNKTKKVAKIIPVKEEAVFPDVMAKRCGKCLEVKSFSQFYKSSVSNDGYQSYCSKCNKAYDKEINSLKKAKRNFDKTERKKPQTQSQYNSTTYFESLRGGKENAGRPDNDLLDLTPERVEFLNIQREHWKQVFAERHDDIMVLIRAYEADPDQSVHLVTAFHQDTRPKWKLQHKSIKQSKTEYYEFLKQKYATRTIGGNGCGDETNGQ